MNFSEVSEVANIFDTQIPKMALNLKSKKVKKSFFLPDFK